MGILKLKLRYGLVIFICVIIAFWLRWRYGPSNYQVMAMRDTILYTPSELCDKGQPDGFFLKGDKIDIISVRYYKECMFYVTRSDSGKASALLSGDSVQIIKKDSGWDWLRLYPGYGVIEDYYQFQQHKLTGNPKGTRP